MFASLTKRSETIAGPDLAAEALRRTELPVVAIGGITAANVGQVRAAGVRCVCACAGVIGMEDVEAAARRLADAD
jgi:thiamine monophosphate synthase